MRSAHGTLLLALALTGCTGRPSDFDTTDTATSTSAGSSSSGSPSTTTAQTSGSSAEPTSTGPQPGSTGADTTGSVFIPVPDTPPESCDVWEEDCPEGQKCMPVSLDGDSSWESLMCAPIAPNPGQLGEPCMNLGTGLDGLDTCDLHMICWNVDPNTNTGHCLGMCTGSEVNPGCADPNASCLVSGSGVLALCVPHCDPLAQDCPDTESCLPSPSGDHFFCILDASAREGQAFDPCEFINSCDPGLTCIDPAFAAECDPMELGCCLPFCDLTKPNTCPGQGQECLPWWQDGMAPPEYANVGLCGLPMP